MLQAKNPYKPTTVNIPTKIRLQMLQVYANAHENIKVYLATGSDIFPVVKSLQSRNNYEFSLIMGSDLISSFTQWKDYNELKEYKVIAIPRHISTSSSEVRQRLQSGIPVSSLVGKPLATFIKEHKLYQAGRAKSIDKKGRSPHNSD